MRPIPLPPLRPKREKETGRFEPKGEGRRRRAGFVVRVGRYLGSPWSSWFGVGAIRSSASFIGERLDEIRAASRRDPRFRLGDDGGFDLEATAFLLGVRVWELEKHLASRRRQTAWVAYASAALALVFVTWWVLRAFEAPSAGLGAALFTLNVLGFALICALTAFYHALVNFQLRSRRAASWKEYLMTDRGFWPLP